MRCKTYHAKRLLHKVNVQQPFFYLWDACFSIGISFENHGFMTKRLPHGGDEAKVLASSAAKLSVTV